ncbi:GNAT family N-acetyltransferase [Brucepastera parasyntrophica]|uniref:GNAT family N-acetyltransferase n=1 Tax=Brucepastera parasyntrophica TaxID=2880008 RepID=UPI00210A90DC|nr:GNAT family N-acetyltransferase [Brucepastera parasyntrophica]ULQ60226.1 GNAT family N-acetyltransferase [Brucepastera parasyntrophica]
MNETITYRAAGKKDLGGLISLYKQLNPEDNPPDGKTVRRIWKKILADRDSRIFLACDSDTAVGSCSVFIIPNLTRGGRPFAVIENVIVDSGYRNLGIGRRLMDSALLFAENSGCYKVLLLSSSGRSGSHRFYEKMGFDGNSKKGFVMRFT